MNVYVVTGEPFPNGMASTQRIKCYAKALIATGIECEIIIFRRTEVYGKRPLNTQGIGIFEGVHYRYIGGTPLRGRNVFIRGSYDLIDKIITINYLHKNMKHGDVILCYMREDSFAIILQKFAHLNGNKIVRDLCEYPYATRKITSRIGRKSEKYLSSTFKNFDGSICISQALYEVAKKFNPQGIHVKVPIMINESEWNFDTVEAKKMEYPYLFHSGTLFQQKDGIIDVINAFADALPYLPKGAQYYFTGNMENSPDSELIKNTIKQRNLSSNIKFLGYLSNESLKQYIKGATAFIIYKNDNIQNIFCFASKLGEYLLSGNPVITTTIGEPKYYLKDKKSAYFVESGNLTQLTNVIIHCFNNPNEAIAIGKEGRLTALYSFNVVTQGDLLKKYLYAL